MKKALITPAVIVVLLVGCRPEEYREQLKAVNRSLEYANGILQDENKLMYEHIKQLKKDPQTASVGVDMNLKVKQIRQYADGIKELIKNIKEELIKQSDSLKRNDVDKTKQLYSVDGIGYQLLNKLSTFKDSIPAIINSNWPRSDDGVSHLLQTVPLLSGYGQRFTADQKSGYGRKWLEESFGHSSSLMTMIMLNRLESDVLSTEKTFIDYCYSRVCIISVTYDTHEVIASLSSCYVKAGQPLELSVGMGSFTNDLTPRITIEGKEMKLDDDAIVVHKFIAKGAPGSHRIPVKVEYTNPDGAKGAVWKYVEYIIAEN